MARKESTAQQTQTQAPLAAPGAGAIQMAPPVESGHALANPLGDVLEGLDLDVTGTEEMDASDVRLPTWALNSKGKNAETGRAVPDDEFLNTVAGTSKPKLRLIVLSIHKSRLFRENDPATQKPVTRCRSWDGMVGIHETVGERKCAGCPDYKWTTDASTGKRHRNCTDVLNVLAIDRDERTTIGLIKVKKAGMKGLREYYQKYFHKKASARTASGQVVIRDNPLFAVETVVEAEEQENAAGQRWFTPAWSMGGVLPKDEILASAAVLKSYLAEKVDVMRATVESDDRDGADVIDTTGETVGGGRGGASASYDSNEFADDAGGGAPAAGDGRW